MIETYRVLVTGARHCTIPGAQHVRQVLRRVCGPYLAMGVAVTVVHGRCPTGGVDLVAHDWAVAEKGATPEPHPADWDAHGKAAGPLRNAEMVKLGADVCLAFPSPHSVRTWDGTWDCLTKAAKAGIVTHIYPLTGRVLPRLEPIPGMEQVA